MGHGFDPSIILAGRPVTGPDAGETARTLADLSLRRTQQQQAEATLADMARQRSRQQTLSGIVQQNAGNPGAVAPALMEAGMGPEAMDWMGAQAKFEAQSADAQKKQREEMKERLDLLARPLRSGVPKSQADLDQLHQTWRAAGLNEVELTGIPKKFSPELIPLFEQMRGLGVSNTDAAKLEQRDEELTARKTHLETRRQMELDRNRRADASRAAKATEKAAKAQEKAQAAKGAHYLEGFELLPEANPSKTEVEKVRSSQATTRTITQTVGDIQKIYKQYGNTPLPGPIKARMSALVTDLQMAAKGDQRYGLGVIAGPDMALLESAVPNPTTANATALDFVGGGQSMERLNVFRSQTLRQFENKARSLGFRPVGGEKGAPKSAAPASTPFQTPPGAKAQAGGGAGTPVTAEDLLRQMRGS